ncbi:MAG TPA: hypothetical protein VH142_13610, partial [Polyangiaceae bacterium]|nr:hypothetical protein [Polyangiaceae bacterium]
MNRAGASTVGRRRAAAFIVLLGLFASLNASAVEYQVVDGQGVAEAENYSSIGVDTTAPIDTWSVQASPASGLLSGASNGQFMVTTPDSGTVNGSGNGDGTKPWLLYEFRIPEGQAPKDYIAYARGVGVSSASNSIWLVITDGNGNYLGTPTGYEYNGNGWTWVASPTATLVPGDYFVHVIMREDGTPVDKITLQLADTSLVPVPTGVGPSQSPLVSTGPDADGDGIPDATENADGDPWTDPNIFNGMDVRLAAQCGTTPTCSTNDTIAEVNQCMSTTIVEEKQQFSGWNWNNPPDSSCSSAYDFEPNWSTCRSTWQADWKGFVNIREDGYQCFSVAGLPDKGCASLYFHSDQLATVQTGGLPECVYRPAGVYPIQWHYTMATNSQSSMQVDYCFGGTAKCMPTLPLPSSMLRPTYSGCVPASCDDLGAQCGTVADGCGGTLNCDLESGGCHGSDTCGGGGTANQCGCTGSNCCTVGVDSDGDGID